MNVSSCSIVGLRNSGAVSRTKSFQNWPGASSVSGGGFSRIVASSKPCVSSVPANDSSTTKTTRSPRSSRILPMPTQLFVGPKAPSGKKTKVLISRPILTGIVSTGHFRRPEEPSPSGLTVTTQASSQQRLLEVGPELVRILEPDAETEQAGRDSVALPARAALERRLGATEAGRVLDHAQRGLDLVRIGDVEREQATEAGVPNDLDRRVVAQLLDERLRACGDPLHAHPQRLQAPEQEPAG